MEVQEFTNCIEINGCTIHLSFFAYFEFDFMVFEKEVVDAKSPTTKAFAHHLRKTR